MEVTLTVTVGPHRGRTFSFEEHDIFLVGRGSYAHFQLKKRDPYFSRAHFLIEVNPPLCRLMDLVSTNGTYVNGERVEETDLRDGDRIEAGDTTLDIRITTEGPLRSTHRAVGSSSECSVLEPRLPRPEQPELRDLPTPLSAMTSPSVSSDTSTFSRALEGRRRFGGYLLLHELGIGAMETVYLARRLDDHSIVALKTIPCGETADANSIARFLQDASVLQELEHPHIVRCLDFAELDGHPYFVTEYVPGRSAQELLAERGPMPVAQATSFICQLLDALDYAHQCNFVHGGIRPANLLIVDKNGRDVVRLADFGVDRVYQSSKISGLTMHGGMTGALPYTPPEQLINYRDTNPSSDLYSAAATLYTLLTGEFVYDFPVELNACVAMILNETPVPLTSRRSDIPDALAAVIQRCLAREPNDRFPNSIAMREALGPFTGT